ncbi:MAG: TSUP family transporter [Halocynthiibacter sp.]
MWPFEVSAEILALLILAGFLAGFVDAIAGGGGLVALPVMLFAGATPIEALSTNKVQGLFGAGSAAVTYARAGHVDWRDQAKPFFIAVLAGVLGAILTSKLPVEFVRQMLPFALIGIALFFALKPNLDDSARHARIGLGAFTVTFVPLVGFYDGLIGPGAGAFYMLAFVGFAGLGILEATARTKVANFGSNIGGMLAFAVFAAPWWGVGLAMGVAQIFGARVGAKLAMKKGAKLIKPLLIFMSIAMAIKLLF